VNINKFLNKIVKSQVIDVIDHKDEYQCCAIPVGQGGDPDGGGGSAPNKKIGCCTSCRSGFPSDPCIDIGPYILYEGEVWLADVFCEEILAKPNGYAGPQPYDFVYPKNSSTCEQMRQSPHVNTDCDPCEVDDNYKFEEFPPFTSLESFWMCVGCNTPNAVEMPCDECYSLV
jgi:hypothetical protein